MLVGDILAASVMSGACALTTAQDVSLRDSNIRIGDLISADCVASMRDAVVARIPRQRNRVVLNRAALAALVHRRAPSIVLARAGAGPAVTFHAPSPRAAANVAPCFAAATAIAEGEPISGANLTAAPCSAEPPSRIVYDRTHGVTRAGVDINAGDYLGRLSVPAEHMPDSGDELTLVAIEGATRIERPVTAAQPAAGGRALFVRDAEGHVFAAPLLSADPRTRTP